MTMGAERAMAHQPDSVTWDDVADRGDPVAPFRFDRIVEEEEEAPAPVGIRLLAGVLIVAALAWVGFAAYALYAEGLPSSLSAWAAWTATASAPLILLALVWLAFGRTSRRESARFIAAVGAMRRESQALESVLGIVSARIAENGQGLNAEAARLMALGDEAADRLGRVTQHLARESADLERRANALDSAAGNARVDIGALLSDLPRAEQQARAAAESLRSAGLAAHEQAAALEGHLAALTARGRDVDDSVGGAAQRLREIRHAAQHEDIRYDFSWRRAGARGRHPERSALRPQPAALRHAQRPSARGELPGGARDFARHARAVDPQCRAAAGWAVRAL